MSKLSDQSPSTRNKGNTSPVKTQIHIYPRKNRWGTVWSDVAVSGLRRNLINKKLEQKIIQDFKIGYSSVQLERRYKLDNDTILKFVKKKLTKIEFETIKNKRTTKPHAVD